MKAEKPIWVKDDELVKLEDGSTVFWINGRGGLYPHNLDELSAYLKQINKEADEQLLKKMKDLKLKV